MKILNRIKKEPSISCIRIDTHTQTHTKLCISKWNYGLSAINQFNSVHLAYNDRIWTFNFLFAVAVATATAVVDVSLSLTRSNVVAFVNNFAHNFAKIIDTYTVSSKNYRIWMRCTKITLIGALCLSHTIQPSFPSCPWTHRVLLMRFFLRRTFVVVVVVVYVPVQTFRFLLLSFTFSCYFSFSFFYCCAISGSHHCACYTLTILHRQFTLALTLCLVTLSFFFHFYFIE